MTDKSFISKWNILFAYYYKTFQGISDYLKQRKVSTANDLKEQNVFLKYESSSFKVKKKKFDWQGISRKK